MRSNARHGAVASRESESGARDDSRERGTGDCASSPNPGKSASSEYTDGRAAWDWPSKYPPEARRQINWEAAVLAVLLLLSLAGAGLFLSIASQNEYHVALLGADAYVSFRLVAIFFTGCVGGTTFSIKWLIHSVAKGKW